MELLVVGLGSMGKRRARLIRGVEPSAALAGVDFAPARREEARALGSIAAAVAARHFDAAFVCTAPLTHAGIIGELLDAGLPVFTELNLVDDGYDALIAKAAQKGLPLFLSSTMLYRAETQYIKRRVAAFAKPVNYIYHIGQYLPDWHPWENYKNFFVGDRRTGGVREIFGIDLPWLLDAFGPVKHVYAEKDKSIIRTAISSRCATRTGPRAFWRRMSSAPKPCGTLRYSAKGCTCSGRATPGRCTATTPKPGRRNLWTPTAASSMMRGTATILWRTLM